MLEYVADIGRKLGSSGAVERDALLGGSATQDEMARTFPRLLGSHLEVTIDASFSLLRSEPPDPLI